MGTSELENGVAPGEYGTFGLFWPSESGEPWKDVMKEPAKNRLVPDAFIVIELTRSWAPVKPVNGGDDQEPDLILKTATAWAGDVKLPPNQSLPSFASQKITSMGPLGLLFEFKGEKELLEGL